MNESPLALASRRLYELHMTLLASALELVTDGCPACVGLPGEIGPQTKAVTRELLKALGASK